MLVTGAGGRLGGRLAGLLASRFRVTAGVRTSPGPAGLPALALDVTDPRGRSTPPACAAVSCAALADADACERDPDAAARLNEGAPDPGGRLAARGVGLVALSTDLVLPGERPYSSESDPALPASVYGRTKRAGEQAADPSFAVARWRSWRAAHGPHPSASEAIAWALAEGRRLRLYTDRTDARPEDPSPMR